MRTRLRNYPAYLATLLLVQVCALSNAQRISFGTWAGSNISILPVNTGTIDFGPLLIGKNTPNSIALTGATAFAIAAPEGYDLTVTIDAPLVLDGPNNTTLPFNLRFAYSNQALVESAARMSAAEQAPGMLSVTFPVKKTASGPPPPPPSPEDGNSAPRIMATVYLFLYGSVGPAAPNATAGNYTGTVNITVDYANYP